jgi:hypothetical protein
VPENKRCARRKKNSKSRGQEINNYDLVVLQEAFSARLRKKIVTATDGNFEDSYVPDLPPQINSGLFAFSKFKITDKNFMPFKNCGGIQCAFIGKGFSTCA